MKTLFNVVTDFDQKRTPHAKCVLCLCTGSVVLLTSAHTPRQHETVKSDLMSVPPAGQK